MFCMCYNKRNPKKGIEILRHFLHDIINSLKLQQKKSQKGNWEVPRQDLRRKPIIVKICYNKRNPKKGIESVMVAGWVLIVLFCILGYNKRNPKKGIESDPSTRPWGGVARRRYNKRNPKKGIESYP